MDEKRGLVCICHDLVVLKYPPKEKKKPNFYEYKLSDGDLNEIKHFTQGKPLSSVATKALTIISYLEGGLHHVSWKQRENFQYFDEHSFIYKRFGNMATYDSSELTTLVVLCHELAVRVEISSQGFRYTRMLFTERVRDSPKMYERHPSIDEVIKNWRNKR